MKKFLLSLSLLCLVSAAALRLCSVAYKFSALLLILPAAYFAFMAYACGRKEKVFVSLGRVFSLLAIFGILSTTVLGGIILSEAGGDSYEKCDYVIVLGAGIEKDKPSQTLKDRLLNALDYLETYPESVAIVSGSQGDDEIMSEASVMKQFLLSHGIPDERIIEEDHADNTNENMKFSKELIDDRGSGSVAVVTSDYHIFRSRRLAENAGLSPIMLSAKTSSSPLFLNFILREAFALVKAYLVFI